MQGQRVEYDGDGELPAAGSYWKHPRTGTWFARCPRGWLVANLAGHEITEHDDGTISVSPSIKVTAPHRTDGATEWHGYLEHGHWREC